MEPKQNGFAVLLIILIIAAVALAGAGVYIYQTQIANLNAVPVAQKNDSNIQQNKKQAKEPVEKKDIAQEEQAADKETQKTADQGKPAETVDSIKPGSVEPKNDSVDSRSGEETKEAVKGDSKVVVSGSSPTSWTAAGFTDPEGFMDFVSEFQVMVAGGQKEAIAELVKYPINNATDKQEFIKNYDLIFNQKVKQAVLSQDVKQIWRNYQGAMIGNGEVWFGEIPGAGYRIIAINN